MTKKCYALTAILTLNLLAIPTAFATCTTHLCDAPIKTLYVHSNGKIYVAADAVMTTLDCTLDQGQFMVLEDTNTRHEEIYAMLLSARIAQESVILRIVNGSSNCAIQYSMLSD